MLAPRALAVLETLAVWPRTTARELALTLGVTEKTIRRDIARLVATGLPIVAIPGRHGGLELRPAPPPPEGSGGWARLRLPAEHLDHLPVLATLTVAVRGLDRPGVLLVDLRAADPGVVARAIAALPASAEIVAPDRARELVGAHALDLWHRCGSPGNGHDPAPRRAERAMAPAGPQQRRVIDRWRELPGPDR